MKGETGHERPHVVKVTDWGERGDGGHKMPHVVKVTNWVQGERGSIKSHTLSR